MTKIVKVENSNHIQFFCPACDTIHALNDTWEFNGDFEKPTFKPSIKVTGRERLTDDEIEMIRSGYEVHKNKTVCHSFITDGKIKYYGDCIHDHSNETMDLPEFE